ncbi:MAG: hypothetical protein K2W82_15930 [Candidatus Obscuribacterales bacterium]|nr:hypothetical protein [Candidatus Obscuribacterales bacterium]
MSTTIMDRTKILAGRLETLCKRHRAHFEFTRAAMDIRSGGLDAPLNWLNLAENPAYSAEENKMRLCFKSFKKVRQGSKGDAEEAALTAELTAIETLIVELEAVINVEEPVVKPHWSDNLSRENLVNTMKTLKEKAVTMRNKLLADMEENGVFLLICGLPLLLNRAKEAIERKLAKVAKALVVLDATARGVTITALILSVLGAALVASAGEEGTTWLLLSVPALFFLRWSLATIETLIVQETGSKNLYDKYLKEIGDQAADLALLIGITISGLVFTPFAVAVLLALLLNSHTRLVRAKYTGNEQRDNATLLKQFRSRTLSLGAVVGALLAAVFGGGAGLALEVALAFVLGNLVLNIVREDKAVYAELNPSESAPTNGSAASAT